MDQVINPEVTVIEVKVLAFHDGRVQVSIMRIMFDGKMSSILSGAVNCALLNLQN